MKAKLCLKNLFIVSTLILIAFAASSCTVNVDPPVYYTITAAEEIENGTVSVDKTSATSGETVKITATADGTYELSALSVTDENGNKIPVTDGSFTMPEGNVVVSATFASIFHNICIAQDIENGTVSVDKESASQGETITVTAEPDEGYLLNSIHVTDADGNEITVTENTFTMPKAHVTVSATFASILAGGTYTWSQVNGGTTASATFTFDSNGTFTGSQTSGSTTYNATGTYTVNGNTATLTGTSGGSVILTTTDGWQHFTMVFGSSTSTFTRQ